MFLHLKNSTRLQFIVFICTLAIIGCKSEQSDSGKQFFRYNQASGITSLDPAFAKDQANIWATHQLYNSLVQTDDGLNILPSVAKSWDISANGLSYTFILRDDVYFHDNELFKGGKGRKVDAEDVVYSYNRIIDPKVASPGAWLFNGKVAEANPFEAINDTTFVLRLQQAFRPMLGILSMQYCSIVPKEVVDKYGKDFRNHPVGTGPFKLKKWKEKEMLVMEKNPNYFEKDANGASLPHLDGISVTFIENKRNAYLKFIEGELDFLSGLDASYKDDLLTKEGQLKPELDSKIKLMRSPYLNTEYLGFLMDNKQEKALKDKRVRQAINYGFDRVKMMRFLRNNVGIPANSGFVPAGLPSFNADKVPGFNYDPNKSRQLLKDAGYENGEGLSEITLETTDSYKELGTFIVNQLQEIGFNIKMELNPSSFLREKMAKGESRFFRGSWIADYPDPENYFSVLYGGNPAPPNYTRFRNDRFDELYIQSLLANNDTVRFGIYQEMDRIVIEEAPVVPLYYDEVLRFVQNNVEGLGVNAFNLLTLKAVKLN